MYALYIYRFSNGKDYFDKYANLRRLMGWIHVVIGYGFMLYWFSLLIVLYKIDSIYQINEAMLEHSPSGKRIGPPLDYTLALKLWRYIFLGLTYVFWFICLRFDIRDFKDTNFDMLLAFGIVLLLASTLVLWVPITPILHYTPPVPPVPPVP